MPAVEGTEGQVVGFDENGDPVAMDPPSTGHTIINSSGSEMTQRSALKFIGANVSDDPTNDQTIVDIGAAALFSVDNNGRLCITYQTT